MSKLAHSSFDVIIIGAGINGAGIARDAAMRGLRVMLLDKEDIGGGTTAASTRLIHGGLRYLEHLEFGLVRESLRERERLLHIAPHLVRPLPMLIPIYASGKRGPWMIRAGMTLYDLLSYDKSLARHRMLPREETLERQPGVKPDGLLGAALYYDAQVEYAERLALENVLSACESSAVVRTYARVDAGIMREGALWGIEFTDLRRESKETASAPITVNAAGPWVDQVLRGLGYRADRMIGGTKGSHIVVRPFPGAPASGIYAEAIADGRPFFIIPWNGQYLIGTTDSRYSGDLDRVEATEDEIAYLISETNRLIPAAGLDRESVLFTYSGVRPLPYSPSEAESAITRRHIIHDHSRDRDGSINGLLSIIGGKLTTYRSLAEQVVDLIFKQLGKSAPGCKTAEVALPGASIGDFADFARDFKTRHRLPDPITDHLLRVYGARAELVMEIAKEATDLMKALTSETAVIGAEVLFAFQSEMAVTLGDVLLRRTMAGLGSTAGVGEDEAAAAVARKYLGWDESRAREEMAAYRAKGKKIAN
ncbi:MAG TPA: glycerol-3-phosphate dehydrogenase [Blastocatellia bacterium]|nr:glycerol-3-phosphate dehydrogenase [Blastocatellia bacterium]